MTQHLSQHLSEDEIIAQCFAPLAGPEGMGLRDDAAVLVPPPGHDIVMTQDALVAGVHFFPDDDPRDIARKALRVNLSDIAAKGADPLGFLLALSLPDNLSSDFVVAFAKGLGEDARSFACPLFGGDTTRTSGPLTIAITLIGAVPHGNLVARFGARAGDRLYVTGTIGDAALGLDVRAGKAAWLRRVDESARDFLLDRYLRPQPCLALRRAVRAEANGSMDVSDGLVGDLAKMMRVSNTTAHVTLADIPLSDAASQAIAQSPDLFERAITGGDDYEILASVPDHRAAMFEAEAKTAGVRITCIGHVLTGTEAPRFFDAEGNMREFAHGSFSHF